MPRRLRLELLGLPQVHLDDKPIDTDRRKAIALLAYLAVNGVSHPGQKYSRESLSASFWPDYEQAKAFSHLRRTIWEVNQVLGEGWLIADRDSLHLNPDAEIDLDVARLQDLFSQSRQQAETALRIPLLVEAVKLYRNHFMTGFSLKDAQGFNEWAFAESQDLRCQFAGSLISLSEAYCTLGQAEKAILYARRLITLDPLNEAQRAAVTHFEGPALVVADLMTGMIIARLASGLPLPEGEGVDVRIANASVGELYDEMAAAAGDGVLWVVGGGSVASEFADEGLLDEVHMTVVPVVLGAVAEHPHPGARGLVVRLLVDHRDPAEGPRAQDNADLLQGLAGHRLLVGLPGLALASGDVQPVLALGEHAQQAAVAHVDPGEGLDHGVGGRGVRWHVATLGRRTRRRTADRR